jgi:DNA protecting protein DprA
MKITLKSVEGLIFLSYLTKYNIKAIYEIIDKFGDIVIDDFAKAYLTSPAREPGISSSKIQEILDDALICSYRLDYHKVKVETVYGDKYPAKLKKIAAPPPLLYYKGTLRRKNLVAIVGTRKPTKMAAKIISLLVEIFNKHGYGIVSGLALGIDSIAHEAANDQNVYTLAVMPNSLDTIYPKENYRLANLILEKGGALASELVFGISHGKKSFVQRNRIQAGMSEIVIPVEMGIKSGTMTTVEFAYNQDKYILLVPPKEEYKHLEQYEGINHFINKSTSEKYKKTYIVNDLKELDSFLKDNSSFTKQEKLF